MSTIVVIPPDPFILPSDIDPTYEDDDTVIIDIIAAVTEQIDGPDGRLQRAIGQQTLKTSFDCWEDTYELPYGPVISVEEVSYIDSDGAEVIVTDSYYSQVGNSVLFNGWTEPDVFTMSGPIRVQYEAGYDGDPVYSGGTGDIPARIRVAIAAAVKDLYTLQDRASGLRSETVEDVGQFTYLDGDKVRSAVDTHFGELIHGMRRMYV